MAELFWWPLYLFGEFIGPIQIFWGWEQVGWESWDYEAYSFLNCSQKWIGVQRPSENESEFSWIEATGIYFAQKFLRLMMI